MRVWVVALCLLVCGTARADDDDAAALALPGADAAANASAGSASLLAESALTAAAKSTGGEADAQRVSVDVSEDARVAPQWRLVFGDRLDLDWAGTVTSAQAINTLKQAYASWQPRTDVLLDAGRINARQGVAFGYNPTDFFRANALRAVDSLDPNSLRDERLGTVLLRGVGLWDGGALAAAFAPRLADQPSAGSFDLDLGATNPRARWLVTLTQRITADLSPQWLLFTTGSGPPQMGLNVTSLVGSSIVAFVETSAGRAPTLWAQALGLDRAESLHTRAATGLTYSAANKLSLTLEYEYDGAALDRGAWAAARDGPSQAYGRYREFVVDQQELPTQRAAFVYASWQDGLARHLDLDGFVRVDLIDHSLLPWVELRYRWPQLDAAVRWQDYIGGRTTDFGAATTRQTWQLLLDYYL